jgi:hypothetical protein
MADTPDEIEVDLVGTLTELRTTGFGGAAQFVREALDHAAAAAEAVPVGDHGEIRIVPGDYSVQVTDVRQYEDTPRFREGKFAFVDVESFQTYADRYRDDDSLLYGYDPYSSGGVKMLTSDTTLASMILDDHPVAAPDHVYGVGRRKHEVALVLRTTPAARRWGTVLGRDTIDQEGFLDLIVDGMGEIAAPDAADLRDLVSDLHAIRSTEVQSVIRTSGETALTVADNVKLHAGPGSEVKLPEKITVVLQPWVDADEADDRVVLEVRVKPIVRGTTVLFALTCADLDAVLAERAHLVARRLQEAVDTPVMWAAR